MPAVAETFSLGAPVEIGRIEKELKKLWADSEAMMTRASLINLAVYSEAPGSLEKNTQVIAKIIHPAWYPPESIRKEHQENGDPLPRVVGPGPVREAELRSVRSQTEIGNQGKVLLEVGRFFQASGIQFTCLLP